MPKECNRVFCFTVHRCVVSPTGDKLYVTNPSKHKLLTLARDGCVIAIFADLELISPTSVHVTPAGQVLVSGGDSHTILQIDSKGIRKLATLATGRGWDSGTMVSLLQQQYCFHYCWTV
ncbi:hypothetical protein DPMN_057610 [Dreissena polymorpha]|uniref:Uncharacterized protein n=1 Tax=Dreissena polymorpha TaxID=45954 RepID=A0A9D4C0A4_DREPO|nr:hypothetical protein DPMN_057610 [Dreissena polymorpha]